MNQTQSISDSPVATTELVEALAATALSLYRAAMVANAGAFVSALRQDLLHPRPGDIVMDVHEWWRPADERLGVLEHIMRQAEGGGCVAFVRRLNGRYETWKQAHLVKINTQPFNLPTRAVQERPLV